MQKVKITITGEKVHDVGYRFFLYNRASRLVLSHFDAWDVEDENQIVEVYAGGDSKKIERLVSFSKNNFPPLAEVSGVTDEDYEGDIGTIASFERSFMMGQLNKFVNYGLGVLNTMDKKQQNMLEGQDKTQGKLDAIKSAVDQGFSELKDEHVKTREMSMEIFHSEVQSLRQDINSLRSNVEEIRKKVGIA